MNEREKNLISRILEIGPQNIGEFLELLKIKESSIIELLPVYAYVLAHGDGSLFICFPTRSKNITLKIPEGQWSYCCPSFETLKEKMAIQKSGGKLPKILSGRFFYPSLYKKEIYKRTVIFQFIGKESDLLPICVIKFS
ncbi:MAG: hypothetical protein WCG84_03955 [Candidatus Moraniibacteriota bacterium]